MEGTTAPLTLCTTFVPADAGSATCAGWLLRNCLIYCFKFVKGSLMSSSRTLMSIVLDSDKQLAAKLARRLQFVLSVSLGTLILCWEKPFPSIWNQTIGIACLSTSLKSLGSTDHSTASLSNFLPFLVEGSFPGEVITIGNWKHQNLVKL